MTAPAAETLRRALDQIRGQPFSGTVYRQHAAAYDPLSGQGARLNGGRWNPRNSFEVIYAALDRPTVDAEFERQLERSRLSAASLRDRRLATIRVELSNVLDLRDPANRTALGVSAEELAADDPAVARAVGQAAHDVGFQGILAPSATGQGDVLAIFRTNLDADATLRVARDSAYRFRPAAARARRSS